MKLLTINIHSHDDSFDPAILRRNMRHLSDFILEQDIDLVAMQEVGQEMDRPHADHPLPMHFVSQADGMILREGNAALILAEELSDRHSEMYWTWTGVKLGYRRFEEGIALFSRLELRDPKSFWVSKIQKFEHWKSRKALTAKIETDQGEVTVCNVHMGWWNDEDEPFQSQMEILQQNIPTDGQVYLIGDFNSPSDKRGEGYDLVKRLGWFDAWELAKQKDNGITACGNIDGWQDADDRGMRLDYIWMRQTEDVASCFTVLNHHNGPVISDHFGVLAELNDESVTER